MENEQRIDLDASEKSDESVCVRVRTESEKNNDTAVELEPNSTAAVQGSSRGRRVKLFVARMIVLHELPLAFVEYVGFYDLLKLLQPSIETISRNTIKAEILRLYDVEKKKTMGILEACESRIAITTDMWTVSNQKKGYMVITAHYIDSSWVLRSRIMRFIYVPAPHSAEVMCNELYDCLMDWNIDRKLSSVTADNCAANDSMIALLGKFSTSSMIMGGKFFHMRCCAHILNLIVRDGLSVIQKGVEKIRDSVHYWTATPARVEKFENAKKQLVGTMLDPRRKMLLINFLFPKIYGERAESEIERVRKLFVDLVHEYEVNHLSNSSGGVNGANSQAVAGGDFNMLDLDLDEMTDEWALFRNENTQNTHSKSELEFYLEKCTLPSTSQFDILSWWKNNQGKYHILAKIARDFLVIPVSTVASESAFSTRDGIPEEAILSAEHLIDESLISEQHTGGQWLEISALVGSGWKFQHWWAVTGNFSISSLVFSTSGQWLEI
ncbi:BED-type domain-containing protein [Citrus sinensis]|nr:BED-type domain-containing protein [Citrus sinensis]